MAVEIYMDHYACDGRNHGSPPIEFTISLNGLMAILGDRTVDVGQQPRGRFELRGGWTSHRELFHACARTQVSVVIDATKTWRAYLWIAGIAFFGMACEVHNSSAVTRYDPTTVCHALVTALLLCPTSAIHLPIDVDQS
jgi:hypothetical protein